MAALYQRSQVAVSPSEHDGTPNTFLEAIACGCFPVVGNLESLREWVQPNSNGFLIDPANPEALAQAVIGALGDPGLRKQASELNQALIGERADRSQVGTRLDRFYREILAR
jgi:glycosyltransferase involved in cell wall biosynthesis